MGEILGLGVTHYPGLYARDEEMANLLRVTLSAPHLPAHAKDTSLWPESMRREWAGDGGAYSARLHRERCFTAFRTIRTELDKFAPDFVLIFGDDQYENFVEDVVPPFCLYILDEMRSCPFKNEEGDTYAEENIWGEPADTVFRHRGHPDGARFIARRLAEAGLHLPYSYRLRQSKGLAHAFINTLMFLDVERKGFDLPVIPFHVNCYGGSLVRTKGGRLSQSEAGQELDPPAPSAAVCFDVGRSLSRVLATSPWRVAIIASSSWSHAFLTRKNDWIYPDHASDRMRLQELREGSFSNWRNLERLQLEDAGQHELLNWIVLAGAMAELGKKARIVDYIETHVFNSNKCFACWD